MGCYEEASRLDFLTKSIAAKKKLLGYLALNFIVYSVVNLQSNIKNTCKNLILLSK